MYYVSVFLLFFYFPDVFAKQDIPCVLDVTALWEFGFYFFGVSVAYLLFKDL